MVYTKKVGKLKTVIRRDGSRAEKLRDVLILGKVISFVGSGGKTSSLYTLGCELAETKENRGCKPAETNDNCSQDTTKSKVIITTTTRMEQLENELPAGVKLALIQADNGKLKGCPDTDSLINDCDYLLIEADGSRGLPIKIPADHEPVITKNTDTVIALVGLKGIGQPISQVCHREELVCQFLNKRKSDIITKDDIISIIMSERGLRKNSDQCAFIVILNQADTDKEIEDGLWIAQRLPKSVQCIITAYENID